jgi:hypothetical protein
LGKKGKMSSSLIVTIEFKQVPGESEARWNTAARHELFVCIC